MGTLFENCKKTMSSDLPFPFLKLPSEVRCMVYHHAISSLKTSGYRMRLPRQRMEAIPLAPGTRFEKATPEVERRRREMIRALLLTCRPISKEFELMLYSLCTFDLTKTLIHGYVSSFPLMKSNWNLGDKNLSLIQRCSVAVEVELDRLLVRPSIKIKLFKKTKLLRTLEELLNLLPSLRHLSLAVCIACSRRVTQAPEVVADQFLANLKPASKLHQFSVHLYHETPDLANEPLIDQIKQILKKNVDLLEAWPPLVPTPLLVSKRDRTILRSPPFEVPDDRERSFGSMERAG